MRNDDNLQPFLVAFPMEEGGQQVMLDPAFFNGADEVGLFLADLARHYARAFVQSGRARDMQDALDQVQEFFLMEMQEPTDPGEGDASA